MFYWELWDDPDVVISRQFKAAFINRFKNLKENMIIMKEQNGKFSRKKGTKNSRHEKLQSLKFLFY